MTVNNAEVTDLEQERLAYNKQLLLCHLNIKQFEELREIILTSKIQLMIVANFISLGIQFTGLTRVEEA